MLPLTVDQNGNNIPPAINGRWHFPITTLSCCSVDLTGTAEARYAGYFAKTEGAASFNLFEFVSAHPILTVDLGTRHAYGRWVLGTASSVAADVGFGGAVASATAQGSAKAKRNTFKAHLRGIPPAYSNMMRRLGGTLDAKAMGDLGQALAEPLEWAVKDAPNNGVAPLPAPAPPVSIFEAAEVKYDPVTSCTFALNQIRTKQSLKEAEGALSEALSRAKRRKSYSLIDPVAVAATYHRFGVAGATEIDDATAKRAAQVLKGSAAMPAANNAQFAFRLEVLPYLNTDNSVPELLRLSLATPARVAVGAWPPAILPETGREEIGALSVSVQTVAKVSAPGMFNANSSQDFTVSGYGFVYEYVVNAAAGKIILKEHYSAGAKVHIVVFSSDSDASVEAVAAQATVQAVNANYTISFLGLDLSGLTKVAPFVAGSVGKFDVTTIASIGSMYAEASDILKNGGAALTPVLTAVDIDLGATEVQDLCDDGAQGLGPLNLLARGGVVPAPLGMAVAGGALSVLSADGAQEILSLGS